MRRQADDAALDRRSGLDGGGSSSRTSLEVAVACRPRARHGAGRAPVVEPEVTLADAEAA